VKPRSRSDQTLWSTAFVNTAIRGERSMSSSDAGAAATRRSVRPAFRAAAPMTAAVASSKRTVPAGKPTPPDVNGAVASFAVRPPFNSVFSVRTAVAESISSA
jgi:hypothetical protein